jgi:hypothetical protein
MLLIGRLAHTESSVDLPYPKFASALKSALRDFRRPELLAENPLMGSRLVSSRGARTAELQALLTETAAALFVSPRDEKLRRALDLTYFNAELKQEAAAERLSSASHHGHPHGALALGAGAGRASRAGAGLARSFPACEAGRRPASPLARRAPFFEFRRRT